MNLLAFLFLISCITLIGLAVIFHDEGADLIKAITERIRHPKPSMLEELHRHWEESDRINRWPNPPDKTSE